MGKHTNRRNVTEENLKEAIGGIRLGDDFRLRIVGNLQAESKVKVSTLPPSLRVIAVVFVIACLSGIAVYAENLEYNKAVDFFDEYKLSSEGLTRGEIKSVYKDISTGKFAYDKTTDVIVKSIGGKEIFQDEPSQDDIEDLWNYRNNNFILVPDFNKPDPDGVSFEYSFIEGKKSDSAMEPGVYWDTVFKKMSGGSEVWSVQLRDFNYSGHVRAGDDTVIFGTNTLIDPNTRTLARIVMIGNDGREKWVFGSPGEFNKEDYYEAIIGEDGITFFGVSDFENLICTKLDLNGNLISHKSSKQTERFYIETAAKLGDGYLVLTKNHQQGDRIIKTDAEGMPVDSFVYDAEDEFYTIRDMAEFGERVFLSAYAVPKTDIEGGYGGRYEIADILEYIFDVKNMEIENDELTKLLRDNYTAVLLLCDPQTGVPQEFYSVKGSLGADIRVTGADDDSGAQNSSLLEWDVESITEAFFSPMTSSFTIGAGCSVYRYTFDAKGMLVKQVKTEEAASYRR